jgi:ABC-type antimicrobial peptide transport system permease subunit
MDTLRISPSDPIAIVTTLLLIVFVIIVAAWLPAHRAARVDPMIALRAE